MDVGAPGADAITAPVEAEPAIFHRMIIRDASSGDALEDARALVRAHFTAHSSAHTAEETERVIAALPSPYVAPGGGIWVAYEGEMALGSAALQPQGEGIGELKRMFVRPEARGRGVARALAHHAIAEARRLGYARMRLGTLTTMHAAQQLYLSLGFTPVPPYRQVEFGDTLFYELLL